MINPEEKTTLVITLKAKNNEVVNLENVLKDNFELISFEHIQDTSKMYEKDPTFKKLVKQAKELKNQRLDYIMKNNYKYK
jgi:glycerate kinase